MFEADFLNVQSAKDDIRMYISKGNQEPDTMKYDYKGIDIWTGGKGFRIDAAQVDENSNYSIAIEAPMNSWIYFSVYTLGVERELLMYNRVNDLIIHANTSYFYLNRSKFLLD